jgi:hypothetical protein
MIHEVSKNIINLLYGGNERIHFVTQTKIVAFLLGLKHDWGIRLGSLKVHS